MTVSLVITSWNGKQLLEKNLPAVLRSVANEANNIIEVIVVDDCSNDDTVTFLKNKYPEITIVRQPKNFGYSQTCNTGVAKAKGDLVVILNNDVIPDKNFLAACFPHFTDDKTFAVSFNENQYGPGTVSWKNGMFEIGYLKNIDHTVRAAWASGGSSVFRKKYWEQLGGMDLLFLPFYVEDLDLGIRAAKSGYHCLFEPASVVQHIHESTINAKSFRPEFLNLMKERNHLLLAWKHADSLSLVSQNIKSVFTRSLKHPGYLKVVIAALKKYPDLRKSKKSLKKLTPTGLYLKNINAV